MPQLIKPAKIKVVPKEGAIEISLDIHITVDGKVTAHSENAEISEKENDSPLIPDFTSGTKLNFGK